MIRMNTKLAQRRCASRALVFILTLSMIIAGMLAPFTEKAEAKAETVTVRYGKDLWYGTEFNGYTSIKWVTHINGEGIDLEDIEDVTRSYAYCVQPLVFAPPAGTYPVSVVDDDDSGKIAKMRKLIYYLPGAYGYTKVTKKRWFSGESTNDAYVLGHLGLSWIYENYDNTYVVWGGAPSSMKSKVKDMVDDLKNLEEPPEDFEVFWVRVSGKQDIFGAFYSTEYGKAKVAKTGSLKLITDGNPNYSLSGAEYTLYKDAECTEVVKDKSGNDAVFTTDANGESEELTIETGKYYAKETKAPKGYALDTKAYAVEVVKDKTTILNTSDVPKSAEIGLLIQKVDKETGLPRAQGAASLEGAEYTVKFYAAETSAGMSEEAMAAKISSLAPAKINGKDAQWVFRADKDGRIDMSRPDLYLIKERSADYYLNSGGKAALPIGIISLQETKAPEGYLIDSSVRYASVTEAGTSEKLLTFNAFTDARSLKEQVIRGDLNLKKSAEGRSRMQGVRFSFTSLTTGESHILVTDKNGYLSTESAWNAHSASTNSGSTANDGIWFNGYNDESTGAVVNDSLGALPYDSYLMEEIRSEANEGYELISDVITIERNNVALDLGTYDDAKEPVPELSTQAEDALTKTNTSEASQSIIVVDKVRYKNIEAGKDYVIEGVMMDKATGEPMLDDEGAEIRGKTEFYADSSNGTTEVSFLISGESLGGREGVIFEYLSYEGKAVAEHTDINSKEQTIKIEKPEEPEEPEPEEPEEPKSPGSPETGDGAGRHLLYCIFAIAASAEGLLLTKKRRNDRLN